MANTRKNRNRWKQLGECRILENQYREVDCVVVRDGEEWLLYINPFNKVWREETRDKALRLAAKLLSDDDMWCNHYQFRGRGSYVDL